MNRVLSLWDLVLLVVLLCDVAFIIVVFFERKNPRATLAWVLALLFLPVVGFVLFLFLGQTYSREKMFRVKKEADRRLRAVIRSQERELRREDAFAGDGDRVPARLRPLVLLLLANNGAVLTLNNRVRVFTDGKEKFGSLLDDIRGATGFVHLEYFIWKNDGIGNEMRAA